MTSPSQRQSLELKTLGALPPPQLGRMRPAAAVRPRSLATKSKGQASVRSVPTAQNINDFFKNMSRDLGEEGQDLEEHGNALKDQLRVQKRAKRLQRGGSRQCLPSEAEARDRFCCNKEAFKRIASCAALPSLQEPGTRRAGLAEWQVHDELWERFQDQPPEPLYVEEVPWPPRLEDILDFYEQVHAFGDLKKSYNLACRRWHPDKFLQRYGSVVPAKELPYMTFRVNEVFQAVTAQWELTRKRRV